MSTRRDHDRSITAWLVAEAPHRAPDDVLEASRQRLRNTRQRRAWSPAWRYIPMNSYAKLAGAAAAVLVVGFLGYQLLPGTSGPGLPTAAPPTVQPSAAVSPSARSGATITFAPFVCGSPQDDPDCVDEDASDDSITVAYERPVSWDLFDGMYPWVDGNAPPDGASVWFYRLDSIFSDPCRPSEDDAEGDIRVGPTVDDLVTALAGHPSIDVTAPVVATLAGYSGKSLTVTVPDDISECDTYRPIDGHIYAQGPSQRWHIWVLDVAGLRVVVESTDYPGTPSNRLAEIQSILDSLVITR